MVEGITKLLAIAKVPTKFIASLCVASGLLLLLPAEMQSKLFLDSIIKNYGSYIGITFLFTLAILFIESIIIISRKNKIRRAKAKARIASMAALTELDHQELAVIREFFIQGQNTLQLPVGHPVIAGLVEKGILEQVGTLGEHSLIGPLMSLTFTEAVKELITWEIVGLHAGKPTQDEIDWVEKNRPEFTRKLDMRKKYRFGGI